MITYVTIPFQIKELTGDPLMVGLLGVCELAPLLFMAFVGGALADYLDRRKLVFWSEMAFAGLTLLLLVNALLGTPQIWLLFVIAALAGAIDGIQRPAMDAIIPRLAPSEKMPAVAALISLRWQAAQIGVAGGACASAAREEGRAAHRAYEHGDRLCDRSRDVCGLVGLLGFYQGRAAAGGSRSPVAEVRCGGSALAAFTRLRGHFYWRGAGLSHQPLL
jgi:MFS family permease